MNKYCLRDALMLSNSNTSILGYVLHSKYHVSFITFTTLIDRVINVKYVVS